MGIDGGGVFKEFLTDLSKEVFDSDRGLWLVNKKNELYPSPGSYATERKRRAFNLSAPFGVHPVKPIASIGTGSSGGYWVRRYMRESWWTLRSRASSSLRSAFRWFHHGTPTLMTTSFTAVVRKTEFPGRPCFSRSGLIPRPHIPEALPRKSRRPLPQFHHRRRG